MNTKFFTHDEVVLPKGKSGLALKEYPRRQISLQEALILDEGYGKQLVELDAEWPSIEEQFNRDNVQVVELAQKVNALLLGRAPNAGEFQAKLRIAADQRDMGKRNFSLKRSELLGKRQALTRPVCVDCMSEWRQRRISLSENIDITEVEEIQHLFDKSDIRIKSNRKALGRVMGFLTRKESELRAMINTGSLVEIMAFIKLAEKEFEGFDPTLLEFEKMDENEHKLIREAENDLKTPVKPETAYFAKGETVRVKPMKGVV